MDLRHEQVRLVRSRFEGGIGSELDVAQAETELATTEAEAASLAHQRDELENAIAILVGENPATFKLAALEKADIIWNPQPPAIPAGLPADLLERRPDVAAAERQLASANAKIGVAKGAFFPVVTLTASGGYLSGDVESLFNWSSHVWLLLAPASHRFLLADATGQTWRAPTALLTKASRSTASRCSWPSATWRTAFPASAS